MSDNIIRSREAGYGLNIRAFAIEALLPVLEEDVCPPETGLDGGEAAEQELPGKTAEELREEELAAVRRQAWDEGLSQGSAKAQEIYGGKIRQLQLLMDSVLQEKEKLLRETEPQLLELALAIAKKIVHTEVSSNPEVIKGVVRDAVAQLVDKENLVVRLNAEDISTFNEARTAGFISFQEDPRVQRGGCVIESRSGVVDAELETRIAEVEKTLRQTGEGPDGD